MRHLSWILTVALISVSAAAQQTTDTNCTVNGNTANCTSTTTDRAAQQRQAYEEGQQAGAALGHILGALGRGVSGVIQSHANAKWVTNYCAAHPGSGWHTTRRSDGMVIARGHCPSDEDRQLEAVNDFMTKHKDYIAEPENSSVLVAYIDTHSLDPREESSYEHAYKDLKKNGQLHLYAR
jgi:hypothetical protein